MGHGITVECGNCHKSKQYMLGVGELYDSLQNVTSSLLFPYRHDVEEILNKHSVKKTSFFHELYLCEKCYRLYERFYVRIDYDEDKCYVTEYECSKCEELLKSITEEEIPLIPCSKCGKKALEFHQTMLWD